MAGTFPFFQVRGSPSEIGTQCGGLFGDRIRACVSFYVELLAEVLHRDISSSTLRSAFCQQLKEWTGPFEMSIRKHLPHQASEMDAMARASQLEPWEIFFINSRTELYGLAAQSSKNTVLQAPSECTALYFKEAKLLGENWDWHPRAEELAIVLEISRPDGLCLVMLTEPGIVGKIGINNSGLGLCLNILFADVAFAGVPVHCILRAILETKSAREARALVERLPRATTSNLLFADPGGEFYDLELHGSELRELSFSDGIVLHTNHYSGEEELMKSTYPSSYHRYQRAREIFARAQKKGLEGFQELLSDTHVSEFPICRSYRPGVSFLVGTVAGIILDLENISLHVVRGQPQAAAKWQCFSL